MKIEFMLRIKDLVDAHRTNDEQCIEAMRAVLDKWKAPDLANKYTREFIAQSLKEELDETLTSSVKVDAVLNQKLKTVIAAVKEQLMPVYFQGKQKPADYAVQVSNALKFLEYEDDDLTDESAFIILKPFLDDYEQMRLFKNVIQKKVNTIDVTGNTTFPKTFEKLNKTEVFLNLFGEIELLAEQLFIHPKIDGEAFNFFGTYFTVKQDGYEEISGEMDIVEFAEKVEEMAEPLPSPIEN